jgi:parallel beta-helix repeat protein
MKADGFKLVFRIIFFVLFVVILCPFTYGKVIYVDDDAGGLNDGSSWQNAYTFLQDALAEANSAEKPVEIRVAQGIYKPDIGANQTAGDREATFQLISGVTLKGSYAGFSEPNPNTRDVSFNKTILSGDLNGNDLEVTDPYNLPNEPTRSENSCRVVTGSGTDMTAVLDGFTITAGNADGSNQQFEGGGMYISSGSPTLTDCTFSGNSALRGGGVFNWENSNPTLTNCTFFGNQAQSGGAIENNFTSSPMLTNCSFTNNSAESGGGMYNGNSSNPKLVDCTFSRNRAKLGGGMINDWLTSPTLTNCTFNDNSTDYWGGGMTNLDCTAPILTDCTFSRNSGIGLYNKNSSPVLKNCIFSENSGGMYNEDSNLTLTNCAFSGNSSGGISNLDSSLTLNNCTFTANSAGNGGGISSASEGYGETRLTLTNCTFTSNLAVGKIGKGGGIYCSTWPSCKAELTMTNCMFTGNQALGEYGSGGGIYSSIENPILTNCIFSGNLSSYGGAIYNDFDSSVNLINCILWGNIADHGSQVCLAGTTSSLAVEYSDLQGGRTAITTPFALWDVEIIWGPGNIDVDPGFVEAGYWTQPTPRQPGEPTWIEGDYHLKSQAGRWDSNSKSWIQDEVTSPCIDAGDPNSPIGHEPFPNGGIINMGAYGGTSGASKSPSGLHAKYGGGTGEPNDPYLIYTAEQMNTIGLHEEDWDKHFKLMKDIDLSGYKGTDFNIIGYVNIVRIGRDPQVENIPFAGVFDGNGHKISNFSYTAIDTGTYTGGIGIFKIVSGENAQIKNLGLIGADISGQDNVGSLAGEIDSGTVSGCYAEGGSILADGYVVGGLVGKNGGIITNCTTSGSVSGDYMTGGLVGYNTGTITDCYSSTIVLGKHDIGGLVGYDLGGTITRCASSGNISGTRGYVGGLLGHNNYGTVTACYSSANVSGILHVGGLVGDNEGTISNCFSLGNVTGTYTYDTGGLVGFNWGSLGSTITDCYSAGSVLGTRDTGGLVGSNNDNKETIRNCFWDIQTSEQLTSAGGTGKTTSELQVESTFTDAGWDFVGESKNGTEEIWTFYEGTNYPRFAWEEEPIKPVAAPPYGGGTGTAANPYLIYTAEQLNMIGLLQHDWGRHFKLIADIDLSGFTGTDFNIIGYAESFEDRNAFTGVFDGNGKTISNFTHTSTDRNYVALFAYIAGGNALIKNLGMINPNIEAGIVSSWRVASLVAINSGTISNCYVKGGTILGNEDVGGLVGDNFINGTITDCYSATNVSGNKDSGGLVGENSFGKISYCYSTAGVLGGYNLGGLVGYDSGDVISSFWDIQTSGQTTSDGGMGKPTAEMQMESTYIEAGWDFVDETVNGTEDIWWILEGRDYPRLAWETE